MKITETIERECCYESKDLKPAIAYNKKWKFCVHCGQLWEWDRQRDPGGSMESTLIKVKIDQGL